MSGADVEVTKVSDRKKHPARGKRYSPAMKKETRLSRKLQ